MPNDHSVLGASKAEMGLIEALMNAGWRIDPATARLYTEDQTCYAILTIEGKRVLIRSHQGGFVIAGYYEGDNFYEVPGLRLNRG